ncbi:MAG: hypothetical protein HY710_03665 [Candidatus Latescibacteria bacterium]|nr:hypothetical protein [Candidatus Latescibacterota bacterium]
MSTFRRLLPGVVLVLVLCAMTAVHAEPYLAVREGLKCSACHVNRTGQGKRSAFGASYSLTKLPAILMLESRRGETLNRSASDFLAVGADFRLQNHTNFRVQGVVDPPAHQNANSFLLYEGNLYGEVTLVKDRLAFYVDERVAPDAAGSREIVALMRGFPYNTYVKVGRMFIPYGLRLWDYDAFIRNKTGIQGEEFGFEVGAEPGPFSLSAAALNAEPFRAFDTNTAKQVSVVASAVFRHARVGGSFNLNTKAQTMGGPFIGLTAGPVTLLGEFDLIQFSSGGREITQRVAYGEMNILLKRGLNVKGAFDYFDPRNGDPKLKRYRFGFEPVITPFLQPRVFYTVNRPSILPGAAGKGNGDQLSIELHVFL